MIEKLKEIASIYRWKTYVASGEPVSLALTKESNDIINDSHFRNEIIWMDNIPKELELVANLVCKVEEQIVALAGTYNSKQWAVIQHANQ